MGGVAEFPARRQRRLSTVVALVLSDVLMLGLATAAASLVRFGQVGTVAAVLDDGRIVTFADLSLVIAGIWIVSLWLGHLYFLDRAFWGTGEYTRITRQLSLGLVVFIFATYLLRLPALSRGWTLLAWAFGIAFVTLGRAIVRVIFSRLHRAGNMMRPTLVVGGNNEAADIITTLRMNPQSGLSPIGCLAGPRPVEGDRRRPEGLDGCGGAPCLGYVDDITSVLNDRFVDTVLIASTALRHDVLADTINKLRGRDVDIQLSSGLLDVLSSRVSVRETSGIPLIAIRSVSFSRSQVFVKRAFDMTVGGFAALVGLPLWILIAIAIKLESPGPIVYRQERVGRGGETFHMYKFRSMYDGADGHLEELSTSNEATGPLFKMRDDPRVTSVGAWLRQFSIDEFPQLLNVLRSEMSLVGPRPPLRSETAEYTERHWRRMEVLPGMTGL